MMDPMVVEVVAKERINTYLMESEKRRALRLAGATNRWRRQVARVLSAMAAQNQELPTRYCLSERTAACC